MRQIIQFMGLSGSGKSFIANELEEKIKDKVILNNKLKAKYIRDNKYKNIIIRKKINIIFNIDTFKLIILFLRYSKADIQSKIKTIKYFLNRLLLFEVSKLLMVENSIHIYDEGIEQILSYFNVYDFKIYDEIILLLRKITNTEIKLNEINYIYITTENIQINIKRILRRNQGWPDVYNHLPTMEKIEKILEQEALIKNIVSYLEYKNCKINYIDNSKQTDSYIKKINDLVKLI